MKLPMHAFMLAAVRLCAPFCVKPCAKFWGLCLTIMLLGLTGCATRMERGLPVPTDVAVHTWTLYEEYVAARVAHLTPYRLSASLRFGEEGDTKRVMILLWSNGGLPVRLDVMATVGTVVARIREGQNELVAFSPTEDKAWVHKGPGRVMVNMGVPVPFSPLDFAALLQGRFSDVFGKAQGIDPSYTPNGNRVYTLRQSRLQGTLELDSNGLPRRWQQSPEGWVMDVDYDDETPPMPYKLSVTHPKGQQAVLLVKSRQQPDQPFKDSQLDLQLPQGIAIEAMRPLKLE